jgi:hypothetical protein
MCPKLQRNVYVVEQRLGNVTREGSMQFRARMLQCSVRPYETLRHETKLSRDVVVAQ